jgi:multiple sugar transport system permease protein
MRTLGLTNTYAALVIPVISGGALSAMIFTGAASGIPREMQESLMIDGGGPFRYYRSILLPLIKPAIGAYSIITIPQVWNSLLGSMLYNKPGKYLLMAFISSFSGTYSTNYQAIYAGLAIALLPILILYVSLKNLFVRAALAGAVKG